MSQLVFGICWNLTEAVSKTSEGMNLLVRTTAGQDLERGEKRQRDRDWETVLPYFIPFI